MCWDMQAILRHVSWICRTPRQLRSTSRGYVERSASFAPALVDTSNAPPASLRQAWQNRRADSGLPPLRSGFFRTPPNGKTALPNKRTRTITLQRRFQTKERVQLLCNGVTKQKNASNYFATAFSRHSLDPIQFSRS